MILWWSFNVLGLILGIINGIFGFIWKVFVLLIIMVFCLIVLGVNFLDIELFVEKRDKLIFLNDLGMVFLIVKVWLLNCNCLLVEWFDVKSLIELIGKFVCFIILIICVLIVLVVLIIVMLYLFIMKILFW